MTFGRKTNEHLTQLPPSPPILTDLDAAQDIPVPSSFGLAPTLRLLPALSSWLTAVLLSHIPVRTAAG